MRNAAEDDGESDDDAAEDAAGARQPAAQDEQMGMWQTMRKCGCCCWRRKRSCPEDYQVGRPSRWEWAEVVAEGIEEELNPDEAVAAAQLETDAKLEADAREVVAQRRRAQ